MIAQIFKKELIYLWRYKVNTISSIVLMSVICIAITSSQRFAMAMQMTGGSKLTMIAPYFMWLVMMYNFNSITEGISSDCVTGILEQLYVNASSYIKVLLCRAMSSFCLNMIPLTIILGIVSVSSKISLLPFLNAAPVILLGIPAIWGLALMAGALILRFKQAGTLVSILSTLLFIGMSFASLNETLSTALPFCLANKLSVAIIKDPSFGIELGEALTIAANSAAYMILGILVFKIAEKNAKKHGKLGIH